MSLAASQSLPFVREVTAEIPSLGPDLSVGGRTVKVFVKGPDGGVNADTGILVVLHGLAGRHNDISYKRLRRDLATKHNVLVVGVNYIGTEIYITDYVYLKELGMKFANAMADHFQTVSSDSKVKLVLNPDRYPVPPCKAAEDEMLKPIADEFWDFGAIQAIDVLGGLAWLKSECDKLAVGPDWRRIHLLSQSAGTQVAAMLFKFAPHSFASHLQIGGIWLDKTKQDVAINMLVNPFGRLGDSHIREVTFSMGSNVDSVAAMKVPVGFDGGQSRSRAVGERPDILDEICLRDAGEAEHFPKTKLSTRVFALHGADDKFVLVSDITAAMHARFEESRVTFRLITEADVDGKLYFAYGHEFTKEMPTVAATYGPELWKSARLADDGYRELFSSETRRFRSFNGDWVLKLGAQPELWFESTPGWKHPGGSLLAPIES